MKHNSKISEEIQVQVFLDSINNVLIRKRLRSSINENKIEKLKEYFQSLSNKITPEKIYSESYLDFIIKYGYSNVLKNYFVLNELEILGLSSFTRNILDIGSGPGVFPLSFLLKKLENHFETISVHEIDLLDCSNEFYEIFKTIWKLIPRSEKEKLRVSFKNELFTGEIDEQKDYSLIVLSNSLGELLRDKRFCIDTFISSLENINPVIIIIDYYYDNLGDVYSDFFNRINNSFKEVSIFEWPSWNKLLKTVDLGAVSYNFGKNRKITSNIRFMKGIFVPKQMSDDLRLSTQIEIVKKYKHAWQTHSIEILKSLFTEDAIYSIKNNKPSLKGIKQIEKYWSENSLEQKYVQFYPLKISYEQNIVYCEWISIFYRTDLEKWMLLKGNFEAQLRGNKICHFKEIFIKQKFDIRPSFEQNSNYKSIIKE